MVAQRLDIPAPPTVGGLIVTLLDVTPTIAITIGVVSVAEVLKVPVTDRAHFFPPPLQLAAAAAFATHDVGFAQSNVGVAA